jgi:hypothetical protein
LLSDQVVRHVCNSFELFSGSQPVGSGLSRAVGDLLLQACDTDFEKFVEIRTDDAQESVEFRTCEIGARLSIRGEWRT